MANFICPVCKGDLFLLNKTLSCKNNHCFDLSKEGYVNLLMSQKSSLKRHGDDKLMVKARRNFLEKGFYGPLRETICKVVSDNLGENVFIVDVGCGEGYYTKSVAEKVGGIFGIDVSKDALKYAAKSIKNGFFAVASAFSLPFDENSADCILNVFAPCAYDEFYRVLKPGGLLIKAVPLENHLWGLKKAVYDEPYKNKPEKRDDEHFELISVTELKYTIQLSNKDDIENLFKMTPYYYKTSREDSEKLLSLKELETAVHFGVELYKKR